MKAAYAQALDSLVRKGELSEEQVYEKLVTHLKETGRMKLLPELLTELKTMQERQTSRGPLLEVASEAEIVEAESAAQTEGASIKAVVNPDLVSGWRLVTSDTLIDRSGKRALIDLYRSIVR